MLVKEQGWLMIFYLKQLYHQCISNVSLMYHECINNVSECITNISECITNVSFVCDYASFSHILSIITPLYFS